MIFGEGKIYKPQKGYGFKVEFIEQFGEKFNIREIAFDRWEAVQMMQLLRLWD